MSEKKNSYNYYTHYYNQLQPPNTTQIQHQPQPHTQIQSQSHTPNRPKPSEVTHSQNKQQQEHTQPITCSDIHQRHQKPPALQDNDDDIIMNNDHNHNHLRLPRDQPAQFASISSVLASQIPDPIQSLPPSDDELDQNQLLNAKQDIEQQLIQRNAENVVTTSPRNLIADHGHYTDMKRMGNIDKYFCPVTGTPLCAKRMAGNFKGWKSSDMLRIHLQRHCNEGEIDRIPDTYWIKYRKDYCFVHKVIYLMTKKDHLQCPTFRNGASYQDARIELNGVHEEEKLSPILQVIQSGANDLPSWDQIISHNLPAINNVPKRLRTLWVHILDQLLDLLLNENDDDAWKLYMITAKVLFHDIERGGKKHKFKKERMIRQRMECWMEGKFGILWKNFMSNFENYTARQLEQQRRDQSTSRRDTIQQNQQHHPPRRMNPKERDRLLQRVIYFAKCGDLSGAVQTLYSNGVCKLTPTIKQQLINKHPFEDEYIIDQNEYKELEVDEERFVINVEDMYMMLTRTKVTKSPGVDGWKPYYLRSIIGTHLQDRVMAKLVAVCRNIIYDRFPEAMARIWATSKGTPLAKDKAKQKARPLAAGICLRRCITSIFVKKYINIINDIIFPLNIGDSRNGTELMIYTLRLMLDFDHIHHSLTDRAIIKHDIENAFNMVFRHKIREVVKKYTPGALQYFDINYRYHSKIVYSNEFIIDSTRGFQQGDGLSIYFPLVIYDIFRDDSDLGRNLINIWYHDDGASYGDIRDVESNINHINNMLHPFGMNLNLNKTEVYTSTTKIDIMENLKSKYHVQITNSMNFECLGSFIGDQDHTKSFLANQFHEYSEIVDILKHCDDKHVQWSLLYYCLAFAKNNYLLRTIPAHFLPEFNNGVDLKTMELIRNILECGITFDARQQIFLPFFFGGMGLRALTLFNEAAAIASWNQSRDRVLHIITHQVKDEEDEQKMSDADMIKTRNIESIEQFDLIAKELDQRTQRRREQWQLNENQVKNQKLLTSKIAEEIYNRFIVTLGHKDQARLMACRAYGASAWISTLPLMNYKLNNDEFLYTARTWLGLNILSPVQSSECKACGKNITSDGIHTQCCLSHGGITRRHNRVRNYLASMFKKAGYVVDIEKFGLCVDQKKPADILVYDMEDGKNLALDVGVTCPVQKKFAEKKHHQQFDAADKMFGIKCDRYEDALDPSRVVFRPLIFESFGGIPKETQTVLKNLAMDLRHVMRLDFNDIYCHLKRRTCVLIWRTNWENARDRISWDIQDDEDDGDDDDIL